jgi:hypothetical protein
MDPADGAFPDLMAKAEQFQHGDLMPQHQASWEASLRVRSINQPNNRPSADTAGVETRALSIGDQVRCMPWMSYGTAQPAPHRHLPPRRRRPVSR